MSLYITQVCQLFLPSNDFLSEIAIYTKYFALSFSIDVASTL